MKACLWLVLGMLAVGWAGPAPAGAVKIKVLKNKVNLRAKPLPTAEVVGQVATTDVLTAKTMDSQWAEVVPPTNVDLWILGDYVKDGSIQSRQKVNVRAGPGMNFAIVGQLGPGDRVTPRGMMTEWVKIVPPESCSLWIARPLVEVVVDKPAKTAPAKAEPAKVEPARVEPAKTAPARTEPAKVAPARTEPAKAEPARAEPAKNICAQGEPKPAGEPAEVSAVMRPGASGAATGQPASAAPEQPAVAAAAPPDLDLISSAGQGQWKQYDGILRSRGVFFRTPSRYRLVSYDEEGEGATVCYVKGNNDQLSTLINRPMIISGHEFRIRKQTYPVLIPERIVLK